MVPFEGRDDEEKAAKDAGERFLGSYDDMLVAVVFMKIRLI
jgi:hypothetical protein